jgi:hypothetical protein
MRRLAELFRALCRNTSYSDDVSTFAIAYYADGSLSKYGFRGPRRIRLTASDATITADLGIPDEIWRGGGGICALRIFLARGFYSIFEQFVARIKKRKMHVDEESLMRDVSSVLETFLADDGEYEPSRGEQIVQRALREMLEFRRLAAALGEPVPSPGVPSGWTVREDPRDKDRVILEPELNLRGEEGGAS